MVTVVSVDNDPFATDSPSVVQAVPVDHDPFNNGTDRGGDRAFIQGFNSSVPFGERITAGLGSLGAAALTGDANISDLYAQARQDQAATEASHPNTELAGGITGIAITLPMASGRVLFGNAATNGLRGAINAIPEGLSQVGNFIRGAQIAPDATNIAKAGALALRSGRSTLVGAPTSALYAYGNAPEGERVDAGLNGLGVGGLISSALPVAGAALGRFIGPDIPDGDQLKQLSSNAYQAMRDNGATLNRSGINSVTYNVGKNLSDSGLMNPSLHGDTISVVDQLNNEAAGGNMDLEKLDQYRQLLGQVVKDNTSKIDGMNSDAYKAQTAIHAIDDTVNGLGPQHLNSGTSEAIDSLNTARNLYAAGSKMQTVQGIIDNANNSDNVATALKSGFKSLAKSVNQNQRGWTDDEVSAINSAAKTGVVTGALKLVGSRLGPLMSGAAGYATGGPLAGAISGATDYAISGAARTGAAVLQNNRAQKVLNTIASRPGIAPAVQQSQLPLSNIMSLPPAQAMQLLGLTP